MSRLKQLVTRLRRPDMREVAVAQVSDKYSEYPSNGLTPVKLAEILREADAGDVLRQMELFEEMEEKDPHLFSQLQTRKNAVTGLDFEVIPFGDEPLDKEIADFIEEQLNGIESFEDVENDLLDAIGKGFAVSEILWGYDDLLAYCKQKGVPFYKMELPSIIVSYANEGARTKIDELKKVKFSKRSNKAAQGDKSLTVDVDMMIVGGVYQDGVAPV